MSFCAGKIIQITNLILDERARGGGEWCRLPYPAHPKGCPNCDRCSRFPSINEIVNLSIPHWFAVVEFDMAAHVQSMTVKHPDWSERQKRCCLYWQNGVRKKLNALCKNFIMNHEAVMKYSWFLIPEAFGIDVIRTAQNHGIMINTIAYPIIYKIALIAQKHTKESNFTTDNSPYMAQG